MSVWVITIRDGRGVVQSQERFTDFNQYKAAYDVADSALKRGWKLEGRRES